MKKLGIKIVVIDNGFVHVGDCVANDGMLRIDNCRNIRVWGTTAGLGQLIKGPLKETKADECGTVLVPFGRVLFLITVVEGW